MKNEKTAFTILGTLVLIFLACACMLYFSACGLIDALPPQDWPVIEQPVDTVPADTITPPVDSIVNPPCEAFEEITLPVFSCFFLNMDVPLVDTVFYYNNQPVNISTFFDTIYYSGQNIAGFTKTHYLNTKVWVRDGGAKHYLAFHSQGFNFRGALTYDQFVNEWEKHKSLQFLRFSNTGYSCEQIISFLNLLLEGCYETPNIVDLRPVSIGTCAIPQNIIDEYTLRGSTIYQ